METGQSWRDLTMTINLLFYLASSMPWTSNAVGLTKYAWLSEIDSYFLSKSTNYLSRSIYVCLSYCPLVKNQTKNQKVVLTVGAYIKISNHSGIQVQGSITPDHGTNLLSEIISFNFFLKFFGF